MPTLEKSSLSLKIKALVESFDKKEQQELLNALERKALLDEAKRLNNSVKKNKITMREIVEEVSQVRTVRRKYAS